MQLKGICALVTGGASGLGMATAQMLAAAGASVTILDLPSSPGSEVATRLGARFADADVTESDQVDAAMDIAERDGPLRVLVHCAGQGGPLRLVDKEGNPGSFEHFERIVRINLIGTFNVLRLAAARMVASEPVDGERGVCVLTASVAAWEGQIGQLPYASSKAGIVGMTLVAARDLAGRQVRICSIAPGLFDTPLLPERSREALAQKVPHPRRLGMPHEYAALARHIVENPMLNGETVRLDGALRMGPV
ncbi:SDR family NAD(P)-dependent oxidoreductase [Mycobacterium avium]|uniref:SDR family NAD(P)-dependent oxidoreductase n=1 Tax=Mycobacterium avium complex (MAC) TaxID=120793 RepID=UPI0019283923|nr:MULTISPECIES: SDR family NAD(P)-dependent oxidoreductase [Mycobacterium avium complex (MAC)]MCA2292795.1 SDR family NAD(P)-dependent oxidoreductase [Mycobacterium avium]BCO39249.1 3-hydroxy-2-methylbutyryl-CoA dehydrogenase [Mycobacterium paraintracellulare]